MTSCQTFIDEQNGGGEVVEGVVVHGSGVVNFEEEEEEEEEEAEDADLLLVLIDEGFIA